MPEPTRAQLAEQFYAARDLRTVQYLNEKASSAALEVPVTCAVDPSAASTPAGQVAARALVDMLVRVHRRVRIEAPDVPLVENSTETLRDRLSRDAKAIDPFQDPDRPREPDELTVVVAAPGTAATIGEVMLTWRGGRGEVHIHGAAPEQSVPQPGDVAADIENPNWVGHMLGAATGACLGAAAVFRLAHGEEPLPTAVNLLERAEGAHASTATLIGPVDVGHVMAVGAGAVGHALAFWCREFGAVGRWEFVDKDDSELHNSNRCMGMTARAAGWPSGVQAGTPLGKARSAADVMGADAVDAWFTNCQPTSSAPTSSWCSPTSTACDRASQGSAHQSLCTPRRRRGGLPNSTGTGQASMTTARPAAFPSLNDQPPTRARRAQ